MRSRGLRKVVDALVARLRQPATKNVRGSASTSSTSTSVVHGSRSARRLAAASSPRTGAACDPTARAGGVKTCNTYGVLPVTELTYLQVAKRGTHAVALRHDGAKKHSTRKPKTIAQRRHRGGSRRASRRRCARQDTDPETLEARPDVHDVFRTRRRRDGRRVLRQHADRRRRRQGGRAAGARRRDGEGGEGAARRQVRGRGGRPRAELGRQAALARRVHDRRLRAARRRDARGDGAGARRHADGERAARRLRQVRRQRRWRPLRRRARRRLHPAG